MHEAFWHRILSAEAPSHRCRSFFEGFGNFACDDATLASYRQFLSPSEAQAMDRANMDALRKAMAEGARALGFPDYPKPLSLAENGPAALFYKGKVESLAGPTIGMVGTRDVSTYGKACALKFAEAFAEAGATVVSGGALGIDAAAHEGALAKGGKTVAVLGTGVDMVYPTAHRGLYARIAENGALVSQFPVGTRATPYRFPIRNHLIAALSEVVVVIEAPGGSGALITANAAAEMGRQVFVVPANITNHKFRGSHALIRDGAALTDHPEQVLNAVGLASALQLVSPGNSDLSSAQRKILEALAERPLSAEILSEKTGLNTEALFAELTEMELSGTVLRDSGLFAAKRL